MRLILAITFVFTGCAAPSIKKSNIAYIGASNSDSYQKMETDLKRSVNAYGHFFVEAHPYTEALLTSEFNQRESNKLDGNASTNLKQGIKILVNDRTCFMFSLGALSLGSAKFENAIAILESSSGEKSDIIFSNTKGVHSIPSPIDIQGYPWSNHSVGCAKKVDLSKGIKIQFGSKVGMDAPIKEMVWTF